jgi:hypothetical protein
VRDLAACCGLGHLNFDALISQVDHALESSLCSGLVDARVLGMADFDVVGTEVRIHSSAMQVGSSYTIRS